MSAVRSRRHPDPPSPTGVRPPPHDLGEGRLEPGIPNGRPQKVLRIDATGASPTLLGRLLVGSYITGQDQVLVTARGGLTAGQRAALRRVVDRLLGMSIVGDNPAAVEVQNFIDPGKYDLPRLFHRLVELLAEELEGCQLAVVEGTPSPLAPRAFANPTTEPEDDRYLAGRRRDLSCGVRARRAAHAHLRRQHPPLLS